MRLGILSKKLLPVLFSTLFPGELKSRLTAETTAGKLHFIGQDKQKENLITMATTEIVNLSDDLDSRISNGVETVVFFDPRTGEKREIELGEANRKHFANHLEKLDKYLAASRVVETAQIAKKATNSKPDSEISKIRTWAQANGFSVGDRGRIAQDIKDAYKAAQEAKSNPDTDAQASGDEPVSVAPEAAVEDVAPAALTDADILDLMAQVEAEGKTVELADLQAKVDNQ